CFLLIIVSLAGCAQNKNEGSTGCVEGMIEPIEVNFLWEPEHPQVGETVTYRAEVTHGGNKVSAQEVKFEIWEHSNADYHYMEETKSEGDGVYTLDWSFDKDGVYY